MRPDTRPGPFRPSATRAPITPTVCALLSAALVAATACGDGTTAPIGNPHPLARPAPSTFCSFDVPGAVATRALGINDPGDIVGLYIDQVGLTHGFALRGGCEGTFTTEDVPGAQTTFPRGINNRGDVVGRYTLPGSPVEHGYLQRDGEFSTINFPGAAQTALRFINDRGDIAGKYIDVAGRQHGFSLIDGVFATVDYPGSRTSDLFAITNDGVMIGDWTEPGTPPTPVHGYRVEQGVITMADVPGFTGTLPRWINERGDIVGIAREANLTRHGYLMDKHGAVTIFDYPGASRTDAFGVNSRGDIAGAYFLDGVEHGYLLVR